MKSTSSGGTTKCTSELPLFRIGMFTVTGGVPASFSGFEVGAQSTPFDRVLQQLGNGCGVGIIEFQIRH